MDQPQSRPVPEAGIIDLNELKEFSAAKRVRKVISKTGQLISEMVCYEPGQSTVPHQHPRQDETFFVLEGCANMNVGGTEYVMRAGSVLSVKSGTMHDVRVLGSERTVIVFVKVETGVFAAGTPKASPVAPTT